MRFLFCLTAFLIAFCVMLPVEMFTRSTKLTIGVAAIVALIVAALYKLLFEDNDE